MIRRAELVVHKEKSSIKTSKTPNDAMFRQLKFEGKKTTNQTQDNLKTLRASRITR